jgi:hypothetical protein
MESTEIILRANPIAKRLLLCILFQMVILLVVMLSPWLTILQVPLAYLTLILLTALLFCTISLYRIGTGKITRLLFWIGAFSIVGGATFDMIVTVIHTPLLDMEANPIARALLDAGHSVAFVYIYGLIAQIVLAALGCAMWAAFLRHRADLVASAKNTNPRSWFDFVKAMTGGGHLSWRQYFLPLKLSELPTSYHMFWILVVIWVAFTPFRFYFGLEWLGLFPGLRMQALILWGIVVAIGYFFWLWLEYRN